MPKKKIENLMTRLHDHIGDDQTSPQQQELMKQLQAHVHNMNEAQPPDPDFIDSVELLVAELEGTHPKAAAVVREILKALGNIGI
jgi:hypothetical protein